MARTRRRISRAASRTAASTAPSAASRRPHLRSGKGARLRGRRQDDAVRQPAAPEPRRLHLQVRESCRSTSSTRRSSRSARSMPARRDSKGVEVEFEYAPRTIEGFNLRGSLNYNRARYGDTIGPVAIIARSYHRSERTATPVRRRRRAALSRSSARPLQNLKGKPTANAPLWTASLGASYEVPVSDDLKLGFSSGCTLQRLLHPHSLRQSEHASAEIRQPGRDGAVGRGRRQPPVRRDRQESDQPLLRDGRHRFPLHRRAHRTTDPGSSTDPAIRLLSRCRAPVQLQVTVRY